MSLKVMGGRVPRRASACSVVTGQLAWLHTTGLVTRRDMVTLSPIHGVNFQRFGQLRLAVRQPTMVDFARRASSSPAQATTESYFTYFGFPVALDIDERVLHERYRKMQAELHPDKSSAVNTSDLSAYCNDAYHTLKSPFSRTRYLMTLISHEEEWQVSQQFLLQTMDLTEAVFDADGATDEGAHTLRSILTDLEPRDQEYWAKLKSLWGELMKELQKKGDGTRVDDDLGALRAAIETEATGGSTIGAMGVLSQLKAVFAEWVYISNLKEKVKELL